jgi:hypothetical protein
VAHLVAVDDGRVAAGAVAVAYLVCSVLTSPTPEGLILPLLVLGVGQGMFMTPVLNVVLSAITENHSGAASRVLTTVQRAGSALRVAVLEVPFFMTLDGTKFAGSSQSAAYLAAFAAVSLCIVVAMASVLVLLSLLPSGRTAGGKKLPIQVRSSFSYVQALRDWRRTLK